ncbi:MAG: hypothetical protein CVU22_23705 [Betaproteobacteria bacterium HGW-Betaproteobacteria-16]|nr:MAG: hypothetical protein CVU22_23705 [Betaproteobacteria bacterium HGW-Betaproteobacteria-16]
MGPQRPRPIQRRRHPRLPHPLPQRLPKHPSPAALRTTAARPKPQRTKRALESSQRSRSAWT